MNLPICLILSSSLLFLPQVTGHKESARLDELRGEWRVLAWDYEGYWLSADEGAVGEYYRNLRVIFTEERVIIKPGGSGRSLLWGIPFTWEMVASPSNNRSKARLRIAFFTAFTPGCFYTALATRRAGSAWCPPEEMCAGTRPPLLHHVVLLLLAPGDFQLCGDCLVFSPRNGGAAFGLFRQVLRIDKMSNRPPGLAAHHIGITPIA